MVKVPNSMMVIWQQRADAGDTLVGLGWKRGGRPDVRGYFFSFNKR
jgi:hypothetical protein